MNRSLSRSPTYRPSVGYVLKMFPRLSETFILNEVLELERQGLSLHIFSLKKPVDSVLHSQAATVRSPVTYLPERITRAPWRIAQAQCHVWRNYRRAWRHTLRNVLRRQRTKGDTGSLLAFCQACCVIREMREIRHLHAHYANVPAKISLLIHRISGASYSVTTHAKDIFQDEPFASPKLRERLCAARFVVANSHFSAGHIRGGLEAPCQIHTIYNGLDLEAFPLRKSSPEEPMILSVGRLVEKKGFGKLIAACEVLKTKHLNFTCELVGTGPLSSSLKEQIREAGLSSRVRLVGPLPQERLRQYYERAMVFALPCEPAANGDRDILPNVVKEAMAVGVPVVTTRLEGMDELIEDGVSGLLIEPGDVPTLAAKLEALLLDSSLRQGLAANGREAVHRRFDRRNNFAGLRILLEAAAGISDFPATRPTPELAHAL